MIDAYYCDAADYYENSDDAEYQFCHDNRYRFYMIEEYAEWLYTMNECIRIWEQKQEFKFKNTKKMAKLIFCHFIRNYN